MVDKGEVKSIAVMESMKKCDTAYAVEEYLLRMANDLLIRCDEDRLQHRRVATKLNFRYRLLKSKTKTASTPMPREVLLHDVADGPGRRVAALADSLLRLFRRSIGRQKHFHLGWALVSDRTT